MPPASTSPRVPTGAALLLGVALGGFIDGILLHQVLQWHHLLSNVDGVTELRTQLLADGLFHVLMYVLVVVALVRLGRAWRWLEGSGNALLVQVLLGFALWQAIDVVGFHWLAGIHRVRVDVPRPLPWDIGWLVVFGGPPLLAAAWLRRHPTGRGGRGTGAGLAAVALVAGAWSAWPSQPQGDTSVVLFAPGVSSARAFDALARFDARVRWVDRGGGVWAVQWPDRPPVLALLREGAVLVSGTPLALGCIGWTQAAGASARAPARAQPL
jgi:uncharacterized membrane protein